jgi:hypothetical protein
MLVARRFLTPLITAVALLAPGALEAQPDGPPMRRSRPRPAGVTRLLEARRQLELTPRQVAQLDSIERAVHADRQALQERLRPQRDSMVRRMAGMRGASRDSIRQAMRARAEELRPQWEGARRRDSVATAAAERVLTDPQRQKLREMRAEERGHQRGLREARMQDRMRGRVREMPRNGNPGGMRRGDRPMPGGRPMPEDRGMRRRPPGDPID